METPVKYVDFGAQYREEKSELLPAIEKVFERGDYILGQEVERFERSFAELCGSKYALGVANGTESLVMCMRALGIGPGDEVITAPNSYVASASSTAIAGATPVFADVREDQNIDPKEVERKITKRTKAIMPVHLAGRLADMVALKELSQRTGIPLIEDAAQAVTAHTDGNRAGSCGLMASFSLHPLKNLNAAGDAGVITTNDENLYQQLKMMRNHGQPSRDEVHFWGFNSRLDTLQAAVLNVRLKRLESVIQRRRDNAKAYTEGLNDVVLTPKERKGEYHTYHVYVIQTERRDALKAHLEKKGIETKIHYPIPIHLQKAAAGLGVGEGSFPVTERQARQILSLPIHQFLKADEVARVIKEIRQFMGA